MITIGIDPGLSGAIAALNGYGEIVLLEDLPVIRDKSLAWIDGGALQSLLLESRSGHIARAIVERVGSMPKQGVASTFTFGVAFGSILSVLQAMQIPIELVTAATWKRAAALGADKKAALHKARLLYPSAELHLEKHHGRAEALLLARHGMTALRAVA